MAALIYLLIDVCLVTFYQDALTSRVCSNHPIPCDEAGECVFEEDAAEIFELGNLDFE